ncbi:DNA repair protein RecN, partial [Arthrobacter sp. Hiyo1]
PVGVLAELGESLVVVHGQSDQIRLKGAVAQRHALDRFAGAELAAMLTEYQELYGHWKSSQAELDTLRGEARERLREAESLAVALNEIDDVDPQPGEDESLKAEAVKLANVEELRIAAAAAHEALISEEFGETADATTLIDSAKRALDQVSEHDESLAGAAARLAEIGFLVNDIAGGAVQLPSVPGLRGTRTAFGDRGAARSAGQTHPQVRSEHRRGPGMGGSFEDPPG